MHLIEAMVTDLRSARAVAALLPVLCGQVRIVVPRSVWNRIAIEVKGDAPLWAHESTWVGFYQITFLIAGRKVDITWDIHAFLD